MNAPLDIAAPSRRQLAAGVVAWLAAGVLAVRPMPSVAAGRTLPLSTALSDELARALAGQTHARPVSSSGHSIASVAARNDLGRKMKYRHRILLCQRSGKGGRRSWVCTWGAV